jgi:GAF domain-containing protein
VALVKNQDGAYPAPKAHNEAARLESLRSYQLLDTAPEPAFDEVVNLVAFVCQTPISLLTLVDDERQWFKATAGIDIRETHRDLSFCAHAILDPSALLEVQDTREDERFNTNPFVVAAPHVRFYAGIPLVSPEGHALGTLCTLDHRPRKFDDNQRRALRAIANGLSTQLELRRTIAILEREIIALGSVLSPPPGVPVMALEDRVRILFDRLRELEQLLHAHQRQRSRPA